MDRKSIIIIVTSVLLIMLWPRMVDTIFPPPPRSTNTVATATNTVTTGASTNQPAISAQSSTNQPVPLTKPDAPEELLTVTNKDAAYLFTSHGGGLKLIELREYKQAIECGKEVPAERKFATLNGETPVPALALLGGEILQGDGVFQLTRIDSGVRAEKQLTNGLRIQKDFLLQTNYLVKVKVRIENTSDAPIKLPQQEWVIGTATPMSTNDDGMAVGAYWYNGKSHEITAGWFDNKTLGCFPGTPHALFISPPAPTNNVTWAEAHNQFFTIAAIPKVPAAHAISRRIGLNNSRDIRIGNPHGFTNGVQTALAYLETTLKEKAAIENEFTIYAGPKEYKTLARLGNEYKNDFDDIMNFGFFSWFSEALLLFLNWLHGTGLNYGWAIILMTVIIKLIFWPLTAASTRSMKRMQALSPKIKELQEKYKDNPQKFSQKQWELFREHKVNPLSGCMPMLVQIPVFIGLFQMLRSAIELRGASFFWACDLSQQDTVAIIAGFPVNPMAIIMIGTSLWQAFIMPMPQGGSDPQQKMMKYLPVFFLVFFYKVSAGLTLYWTVQNLLTIAQTQLTKTKDEPPAAPGGKLPAAPAPKKKK